MGKLQILHGEWQGRQTNAVSHGSSGHLCGHQAFSIQFYSSRTWWQEGRRTEMTTLLSFSAPHFLLFTSPPAPFSPISRRG